jgi:signal transduction histidine kinase
MGLDDDRHRRGQSADRAGGAPGGQAFLRGDGEMAGRIATHDWSGSLGPIEDWPDSLKTAVGLLVHSAVPIVLLWGADGIMIYNDAYSVFAGGRHPRLLGSKVREGWAEVADFNDNVMRVGLAGGTLAYRDQELTLHRSGKPEPVWMNLDYSPVLDESGRPGGVIAIVVETTARVLADRAIAEQRDLLSQMFEQAPTFMAMLRGPEHRFELANPGYVRLVDNRPVLGLTVAEALPEAASQGYIKLLDRVFASGEAYAADGAKFVSFDSAGAPIAQRFLDFVYQPIKDATGRVVGIFVEGADVTARTLATEALRESEARLRELNATLEQRVAERTAALQASETRLRTIFETGYQYQGMLTPDGIVVDANAVSLAGINKALADVVGVPFWETPWFAGTPGLPEMVREAVAMVAQGGIVRRELHANLPVGGWRWFDFSLRPLRDSTGQVIAIVPEAMDFTERRTAEEALLQAQKMEAVGQLTGGIAHDFNNLLAAISGSLELLEWRLAQGRAAEVGRYIEAAQGAAKRAATLTQRLLAFSRRQTLDPKPTDLNRLIDGMEDLIRRTVGPTVAVGVARADEVWTTRVDPSQMENSLLNLCINARDAMAPDGGSMTIATENATLDERAALELELPAGHYVVLEVTDTGTGMTPDVMARAFDPFFTTKPLGTGTGLGLSMIYGFVRQSGGQVRIHSELGRGTTMKLYLPRHAGSAADAAQAAPPAGIDRGDGETVLVVDDESAVRMLIVDVLQENGYRALEAADGPAALRILRSAARIDLLLTDVGLPGGMNGRQVADAARDVRPGLKVLFVTGYAETAAMGGSRLEKGMAVISKPFELSVLGGKVRALIEE